MNKEETDLIIAEQNKSTEEILKAVAKVKTDYYELCKLKYMHIAELEKENAELKKLKRECETSLCRAEYQYNYEQLTNAKEIIKNLLEEEKNNMYWEMNGSDKSSYYEVRKQAEQFLKE